MKPMISRVTPVVLLCVAACFGQSVMDLHVSPHSDDRKLPLTQALGLLGFHLSDGYVLFGIDLPNNVEPNVDINIQDTTTLGTALAQMISQVPGYTFQVVSKHVIDIYPIDGPSRADNVLNIRIDHFNVTNEPAMNIFWRPNRFMPELRDYLLRGKTSQTCGSLGPGISSGGAGVTLQLEGNTVKQILDAVAEADAWLPAHLKDHSVPVGWVHRVRVDPKNGPQHDWSPLSPVPHAWERIRKEESESE